MKKYFWVSYYQSLIQIGITILKNNGYSALAILQNF